MRKFIIGLLILFVGYVVVTDPRGAANVVENVWNVIVSFFDGVVTFFVTLL